MITETDLLIMERAWRERALRPLYFEHRCREYVGPALERLRDSETQLIEAQSKLAMLLDAP